MESYQKMRCSGVDFNINIIIPVLYFCSIMIAALAFLFFRATVSARGRREAEGGMNSLLHNSQHLLLYLITIWKLQDLLSRSRIMFSFASSMGDDGDFICFIGELKNEMNNNSRYVKEILNNTSTAVTTQLYNSSWGIFCLSLHSVPSISVCCRVQSKATCRFYSLELTKDILKEHV